MRFALTLSTALLLALAACGKPADTPAAPVGGTDDPAVADQPDPLVDPATVPENPVPDPQETDIADLPRSIVVDDDVLKADIKFDEAVFSFAPAIAMDVVEDARIRIDAMREDAVAYKQADPKYFRPYGLKIDWTVSGASGRLAGLEGFIFTYTGGAHGNYMTDGRIYDTLTGDQLRVGDLFTDPDAAASALEDTVHKAIADAKVARSNNSAGYEMFLGESKDAITVSDILAGEVSLVASTEAGRLGGFALHFAPYEIGSYAEGAYHITVPQSEFRKFLKPDYLALFAGAPAEIKRPDN